MTSPRLRRVLGREIVLIEMGIGGTERRQPDVGRGQGRLFQRGLAGRQLQRIERDDRPLTVGDDEEVRRLLTGQDVLKDGLKAMIDALADDEPAALGAEMIDDVHDDVQDVAKGAGRQVNGCDQQDEYEPDRERGDGVGQRPIETGGERHLQREEEEENGYGQQGERHRGRHDQSGDLMGGPIRRGAPQRPDGADHQHHRRRDRQKHD